MYGDSKFNDAVKYNERTNTLFVSIVEGILCERRKEDPQEEGFELYHYRSESQKGKTIFMRRIKEITGYLVSIEDREEDINGKKFQISKYVFQTPSLMGRISLEVPRFSRFSERFLHCVEQFDFHTPLTFGAFYNWKEDQSVVWFKQAGDPIRSIHTKDDPHGLPAWTHSKVTNKWNNDAYWEFLLNKRATFATPDILTKAAAHRNVRVGDEYARAEQQMYTGPADADSTYEPDRSNGAIPPMNAEYKGTDDDIPF